MPAWHSRILATALAFWGSGVSAAASAAVGGVGVGLNPITSKNGEVAPIPSWDIISSEDVTANLSVLSRPGADTGSWHHIPLSRCTLMGCLIHAGVYKEDELWFSNNLEHVDTHQFSSPWYYRAEFALPSSSAKDEDEDAQRLDRHYVLPTHGISSSGEIWLNGKRIANESTQSASYVGHEYDITDAVSDDTNVILVKVNPTNYFDNLAIGWVDWNPTPPDNGTGVWRNIEVKQTGPVRFSGALSADVDINPGSVRLHVRLQNLKPDASVVASAKAVIQEPDGGREHVLEEQTITLKQKGGYATLDFNKTFEDPKIWWPKQWGEQPLYTARISVSVNGSTSDVVERQFGLRTVTKEINEHEDIIFRVNGHAFQVFGGGFGSDMFLRWNSERFESIAKYMLDIGLNTLRLEGKMEQPELYEIADRLGLMVMAGWECCDKWEAWEYNGDLTVQPPPIWDDQDYTAAGDSMSHEAQVIQPHPSLLAFLVGSDFWPDDRATKIYVDALSKAGWQVPVVASASKRGYPQVLGPSGMKMDGPYDWVPPNYWYDTEPSEDRYGSAFGFGSELGSGVGTPEMGSLTKFLSKKDLEDLWKQPDKGLYHMSTAASSFYTRKIYNEGLYKRYGPPTSLEDYLFKAQISDYEATRAQHEGFAAHWSTGRIATGMIYWMLDNAWPSLHWNQFDRYLHPAGSYFGSKVGSRLENAVYDYEGKSVWLINRSLDRSGSRSVDVEVIDLKGKQLGQKTFKVNTVANKAVKVGNVPGLDKARDVSFVRLTLHGSRGDVLSRNVYWVAKSVDQLDWANSTWYHTPVTKFADYKSLFHLDTAKVKATSRADSDGAYKVTLENQSNVPAFFIRLNLVDRSGNDVNPVTWSDNYVTLWPKEKLTVEVLGWDGSGKKVQITGVNVKRQDLGL